MRIVKKKHMSVSEISSDSEGFHSWFILVMIEIFYFAMTI